MAMTSMLVNQNQVWKSGVEALRGGSPHGVGQRGRGLRSLQVSCGLNSDQFVYMSMFITMAQC